MHQNSMTNCVRPLPKVQTIERKRGAFNREMNWYLKCTCFLPCGISELAFEKISSNL
jgi:hypothetical protein